ncbi:hypothetical protein Bbelb_049830, partial [Branchiostoma belcheri]
MKVKPSKLSVSLGSQGISKEIDNLLEAESEVITNAFYLPDFFLQEAGGVPPYVCVCFDTTTGSNLQTLTSARYTNKQPRSLSQALWSLRDRGNAVGPWQAWPLVWFEKVLRASRALPPAWSRPGQWWIWKEDGKVAFVNDGDGLGTIEDVWKQRRLAIRTVRRLLRDRSNNTCTGRGKQWRGHGQAAFCR